MRLWKEIGEACGWKHPRAPSVRNMFRDEWATEAVLIFLRDTKAECVFTIAPWRRKRERERADPARPRMY